MRPHQHLFVRRLKTKAAQRDTVASRSRFGGLLDISDEVASAVDSGAPVVALESTIYTHGSFQDELGLEDIVRAHGAVPAVVGIDIDGVAKVGLTPQARRRMVESGLAVKASRRDLAHILGLSTLGSRRPAGTTIAATMILARLAGIRVFGTGGLGGVHRGGHKSMDVSADLTELGRTRIAVVCSGCKGFLDIARTLEYLETQGVPVATFSDGRTGPVHFPGFWVRETRSESPLVIRTEEEAAAMIHAQEILDIRTGLLFANPIPQPYAIPSADLEAAIETSISEAEAKSLGGSANTPFLLGRIRELTGGLSVIANRALVRANVESAAKIAVELSRLTASRNFNSHHFTSYDHTQSAPTTPITPPPPRSTEAITAAKPIDVLVAGSVAVDISCDLTNDLTLHTSNPARLRSSVGGVGHNISLAVARSMREGKVAFCSLVGDDLAGSVVMTALDAYGPECGLDVGCVKRVTPLPGTAGTGADSRTAQYFAVHDKHKDLHIGIADMDIFSSQHSVDLWRPTLAATAPKWLVVDANWRTKDIRGWMQAGRRQSSKVVFEPVSTVKAARLFCATDGHEQLGVFPNATLDIATPNKMELAAMFEAARSAGFMDRMDWFQVIDQFRLYGARRQFEELTSPALTDDGVPAQAVQLLPYIPTIVTKLGDQGALLTMILRPDDAWLTLAEHNRFILARGKAGNALGVGGVLMRLFAAEEIVDKGALVNSNGAGDTFCGVLVACLAQGHKLDKAIEHAQRGARLTCQSPLSVSQELVPPG